MKSAGTINRLENLLILFLICSALFLVSKSGILETVSAADQDGDGVGRFVSAQGAPLAQSVPVRLMVQTSAGRYGVQYNQAETGRLYSDGLGQLLNQSLAAVEEPRNISEQLWQESLSQGGEWIYFDFLYDIPFTTKERWRIEGARLFLICVREGRAESLYCFQERTGEYCGGALREGGFPLPESLEALQPNGGRFAFEIPEVETLLSPRMILLPQVISCPIYDAYNPIGYLEEDDWERLLTDLEFNAKTVTPYTTADGTVIREGADTLRVLNNGAVVYHGTEDGEARYQARSSQEKDLRERAEEILEQVRTDRSGQERALCQRAVQLPDGQVELTYCYLLNGSYVQLWEDGWAARFLFQGERLTGYTICLRQYWQTEFSTPLMPERQAAAAAAAMGSGGTELQVCYLDDGGEQTFAGWTVREAG